MKLIVMRQLRIPKMIYQWLRKKMIILSIFRKLMMFRQFIRSTKRILVLNTLTVKKKICVPNICKIHLMCLKTKMSGIRTHQQLGAYVSIMF